MIVSINRALRALALAAGVCLAAPHAPASAANLVPVRFAMNPHFITYTAIFDAIDKGYFKDAGIDLQMTTYKTSASAQIPALARGDLDMGIVVPGPGIFNQNAEGFTIKIVAAISETHPGYLDGGVLMVRKDLWDSGKIRKTSDLIGKNIDGAFQGSPVALLTLMALSNAHIKESDVHYTMKEGAPSDQLAGMLNKAVDVQATTEPTATAMVVKGLAVKWLSYRDVMPWYQDSYLGASGAFAKSHPDLVTKFIHAYLRGAADVAKANGKMTPDLITLVSKWTEIPPDTLRSMGLTPYYGARGNIKVDSLDRIQKFWQSLGLVKAPVPISNLVDTSMLTNALKMK